MGRRKKYFTEEDKIIANRKKVKKFYENHKEEWNARCRDYYRIHKELLTNDSKEVILDEQSIGEDKPTETT